MSRILVLGAGLYYAPVLRQLRDAGLHVLAVDRDPQAAGAAVAHEFAPIDFSDAQAVLAFARERGADGVMPVNDFGVRPAAFVAQAQGWRGISPQTAQRSNDKGLMRDAWAEAGLPQPPHRVASDRASVRAAAEAIGFPCVLKPTDCGGSGRGISVIDGPRGVDWAFDFAAPYVQNERFIVEGFLDGIEMTIESFSLDGEVTVLAASDKVKPPLRTRVATSLHYPANFASPTIEAVYDLVQRAVLALGIDGGMSHSEVIVTDDGPKLVELGARGGGGHVFHTLIEAVSGVNAPVLFGRWLCGEDVRIDRVLQRGGVYRFFTPPHGVLRSVSGLDEARAVEGVLDLDVVKRPGDVVGDLENSLHRAGFVVTTGSDRAAAMHAADEAEARLRWAIDSLESGPTADSRP